MNNQEILMIFQEHLNVLKNKSKYKAGIKDADQEKAIMALKLVLDNPSLSFKILDEILTGERMD